MMRKWHLDSRPWPRWRCSGASCSKLQSRDQLNKGVQAFKSAQYPEAVEHFKTAVELDPSFSTARLYLATAYMQQYIPGAESPENKQMAKAAYDQFQKVLEQDPKNTVAIASIASLYLNQKKWDDAQRVVRKADRRGPEERGRLLQPRVHRLVEVVSGVPERRAPTSA